MVFNFIYCRLYRSEKKKKKKTGALHLNSGVLKTLMRQCVHGYHLFRCARFSDRPTDIVFARPMARNHDTEFRPCITCSHRELVRHVTIIPFSLALL
jgi:hypothetical protein